MNVRSSDGVSIAYQATGIGNPTLVFVHGWCCDKSYWEPQVSHFAQKQRVVTIDLAGHGASGLERDRWTMATFGEDVAAVVNHLALEQVVLIGHSMGGNVIVEAAQHIPEGVLGIVGVDTFDAVSRKRPSPPLDELMAPFRLNFVEAARQSIVLLQNKGNLLPLDKKIGTLAIIGPNAESQRNLLGDYTYPAFSEFLHELQGTPLDSDPGVPIVSILDGIKAKVSSGTKLLYAKGCEIHSASEEALDEAVRAARAADVAILVVGGKSGGARDCTCGEGKDAAELNLTPSQKQLVEAVCATGTPVVVVLVSGRPHSLKLIADRTTALIEAWLPGEEGGRAVADVIFGDYNPGGKLPISFPEKAAQIPVYYAHKPSKGKSPFGDYDYVDGSTKPLFEFGFGLSYTNFDLSNLRIEPSKVPLTGTVSIKVDIINSGATAGDEVVQLYINDVTGSVTRPVKELKGFQRVHLQAGEKRTVEFTLATELFTYYNKDMKRAVEPGVFKVMVGCSSADIRLEGELEVAR